jgi:hypothetical protein
MPGMDLYQVMTNELNKKSGGHKYFTKFYAAEVLIALEMLH